MTAKFHQLTLPVSWAFSCKPDDFVVTDCNKYAYTWLEKWPFLVHDNFVCLVGTKGSGKSHMSEIWANRFGADVIYASSGTVFDKWFDISSSEINQKYFVLDDADELKDDVLLFYIYNTIKEKSAYLLLTAKTPPAYWDIKLLDVKSRFNTINVINIYSPNEEAFTSIIKKMFLQRGVNINDSIISYIAKNVERSYESINYWVKQIDDAILREEKITLSYIKSIIS